MIEHNQLEPIITEQRHPDMGNYTDVQGRDFECMAIFHKNGELWAHYKNTQTNEEYTATLASFKSRFTRQP